MRKFATACAFLGSAVALVIAINPEQFQTGVICPDLPVDAIWNETTKRFEASVMVRNWTLRGERIKLTGCGCVSLASDGDLPALGSRKISFAIDRGRQFAGSSVESQFMTGSVVHTLRFQLKTPNLEKQK